MTNYESDIVYSGMAPNNWKTPLWDQVANIKNWNEESRLIPSTYTPTISASTTATNLSSLEVLPLIPFRNNRRMDTLKENLKVAQPEIEPLQNKQNQQLPDSKGSINSSQHGIDIYKSTTTAKPTILYQVITALSVSLVSLVIGFVSAYTSPASDSLKKELDINDNKLSWVAGLMPLGALLGGLVGGQLIEYLGRKLTIVITDLLFILSWLFIALATNIWLVYVGRAIAGFSVGIGSLALPVYLGETIQPEVRGTLGLLPTAFGNIGILFCFACGSYLSWSNLAWIGVALPMPFLLLTFLIPESPRWYIAKDRQERARDSLQLLRGKNADIEEEFDNLNKSQKESYSESENSSVLDLFKKNNLKPLLISLGLMFFQQMSGINAVIFYTTDIFQMTGSTLDKNVCTIIVGAVNFISTFIATVLIDRLGRKILLYISSISMVITLGILGTYFYLISIEVPVAEYGWVPLVSFVLYVLGFSLGFGPIPWLMLGEIFPAKIRGSAASLATAFNWACTFIVTKTFVDIIHAIGPHGTFWMYAGICVISLGFVIVWVPETQGQSLQDIERKLAGYKVRRMSSVANLKPLPSTF